MLPHDGARITAHRAGLALVILLFGLPLYVGLDRSEVANDEAIYSYAVERILETGDWLTPRSIPDDGPFFEKPPLKFWMVAAPMAAGLVPATEPGMRLWDATFGLLALAYVYLLGARLAGPICGVAAAFLLFTFHPIVSFAFRMNHMDGTLVLAYCAGLFHFLRWTEAATPRHARVQAVVVALFFTLAFMTKFVAAFFLPLICVAVVLAHPRGWTRLRTGWTDWLLAAGVALPLMAPWFIYHSLQNGHEFWRVLVGDHVYARFAGTLVPDHLAPWHHYVTATWRELGFAQMKVVVVAGLALLAWAALRSGDWTARAVLIWLVLPYALMSLGTSKLLHYAFPFIPPLAIAGGYAVALAVSVVEGPVRALAASVLRRVSPERPVWTRQLTARAAMVVVAALAVGLAIWTARNGRISVELGDTMLFRNTSVIRPLLVAAICLGLAGVVQASRAARLALVIVVLLPIGSYESTLREFNRPYEPIRAIRNCVVDVQAKAPATPPGMMAAPGAVQNHIYHFYFRHAGPWAVVDDQTFDYFNHAGPWEVVDAPVEEAILERLALPGPAFVTTDQLQAVESRLDRMPAARSADHPRGRPAGVLVEPTVVALLPGPFEACVPRAIAGGALPLSATAAAPTVATR